MSKFKITEITEWEVNRPIVQSIADHSGDYNTAYADACQSRDLLYTVGGRDLPFECEAETQEEALAKYAEKYANEVVVPTEAVITPLRRFVVSLQVDTRIEVEVYADSAEEAGKLAKDADFEMKDLEFIESHVVNAYDPENDTLTDLC